MIFIKKFSIVCLILFLIFIQFGYHSKTIVKKYYEDSTDLSIDGSTDIPDYISSDYEEHSGTTLSDIKNDDTNPPQDFPSSVSTPSSSHSTALSSTSFVGSSSTEITSSSGRMNTSTTKTIPWSPSIKCNDDGLYDGLFGVEHWPPVLVNESSIVSCPYSEGNASWFCTESAEFDQKGPDWSNCLADLEDIPDIPFVDNAIELIQFISNITAKNDTIVESEKLSQVLNIISKVQTFVDSANGTNLQNIEIFTNNIVETFTHVMDQKEAWVNSTAAEKTALASKILIGTHSSTYTLSLKQNSSNDLIEIQNNDFYINTFYTNSSSELKFPLNRDNDSSIIIPSNTLFVNSSIERNTTAIGAIIRNLQTYLSGHLEEDHEINSDILSFSLTNSSERIVLNQEVTIILKHKERLQFGDKVDCVFWDFNQSKWSSDGCRKSDEESNLLQTVCKCNHLTNFAALMDVKGRESQNLVKSLLTCICSIVSIFGLIFTINLIIRSKTRSERTLTNGNIAEMRSIITCNLCICLLITNILVLVGMDRTNILWLCQLSSALLLYSLLSSFFWMLMEGYYLYKSLVLIFNAEFKASYLYGVGYGLPIGIFLVSFVTIYIKENILLEALFDERYNYFCWISSSHYPSHIWILIGPAVCVIVSNCILMYISLRTAFKILRNQSSFGLSAEKSRIKFKQIISFIFILFLLGITWLSFLFYINQFFTKFFTYLFIALNGSQGFFIFLYHLSIYDFKGGRKSNSVSIISKG